MTKVGFVLAILLLAKTPALFAQTAENGDQRNGEDHDPTMAEVTRREDRAGTELSPAQAGAANKSVEQLARQLRQTEQMHPP